MAKLLKNLKLDNENRVVLTGHLFRRREGESRSRISVFHNSFQILNLIRYAIKEVDLLSYKNKGKLALIVPLLDVKHETCTYGISISVEPSTDTCNYKNDIEIITIDKRGRRHYTDSLQLSKSKCRFYLDDYKIVESHNSSGLISKNVFNFQRKKVQVLYTPFFSTKEKDSFLGDLPKGNSLDSFFISLFSKGLKDNLNKGAFWYLANIENGHQIYVKVSIEESWNQKYYQLIVLDAREKSEYVLSFIAEREENIYEGQIEVSRKISRHRQNRLKIVKKENF